MSWSGSYLHKPLTQYIFFNVFMILLLIINIKNYEILKNETTKYDSLSRQKGESFSFIKYYTFFFWESLLRQ